MWPPVWQVAMDGGPVCSPQGPWLGALGYERTTTSLLELYKLPVVTLLNYPWITQNHTPGSHLVS